MWLATLRDLQWRARRFLIAVLGTTVVFAMTLVLAGLSNALRVEAARTVDGLGADAWVMPAGVHGPFLSVAAMPEAAAAEIRLLPGVRQADPLLVLHQTVVVDEVTEVTLIGYRPGRLGAPRLVSGRMPEKPNELVVDAELGAGTGASVTFAGRQFTVTGTVRQMTVNGGQPLLFMRLADAQQLLVRGLPIVSMVLTAGVPASLPAELTMRTPAQSRRDLVRPMDKAVRSIDITQLLLWCVAGLIVGSVVYLSALERLRDFAVFKATGAATRTLLVGLASQSVAVALAAALLAAFVARLLVPLFPLDVVVPGRAYVFLPIVGLVVGLLACLSGLRRAVAVDPATAFGGP